MIELMMVVAVLGIVIAMVSRFVAMAGRDLTRSENRNDLQQLSQRARDNLAQVMQSEIMLLVDSPGVDLSPYRSGITAGIHASASGAPGAVSFSALPLITHTAVVDASIAPFMGNQLMMAISATPLKITVQTQSSPVVVQDITLDRYSFVSVYLGANFGAKLGSFPTAGAGAMQLTQWRSIPYVSYTEMARFTSPKLDAVCKALVPMGYTLAWDEGNTTMAAAFHTIQSGAPYLVTNSAATPPSAFPEYAWSFMTQYEKDFARRPDPLKPLGRTGISDVLGGVSGFPSRYAVAYNTTTLTTNANYRINSIFGDYGSLMQVPLYAQAERGGPGFPGGFEVALFGLTGTLEMWGRITLIASSGADPTLGPKNYLAASEVAYASLAYY